MLLLSSPNACDAAFSRPQSRIMNTVLDSLASIKPAPPEPLASLSVNDSGAEALLLAYAQGDAAAFNALFELFERPIFRYLLRHVREQATADELFQDVWLAVIKHAQTYQAQGRFESWLFTIAHHRLMDFFRVRGANLETETLTDEEGFEEHGAAYQVAASVNDQPEVRVMARAEAQTFLALVEELPPKQREVFLLQEEGGLSLAEIAQATGVNTETIKSRLRYAMNKLRSGMKGLR